ncbi:hypothetical protein EUGRSUZ_F00903 [Eucalyptus grandis]|uniref:Uncharacterized protein n=2 Tax=Eucalyptus grandis TaxID=71139 RepID=A0ACC3KD10_EUCGR|nr:hypothetical protein EUGRSUZ_F00903 [Eucalyptus grandis]
MPREKDPFRKYATFLNENNSKWRCNFCGQEHGGSATRIKAHLAGIGRFGIKGCERVDVDVKAEATKVLMAKTVRDSSDRGVAEERIPVNAGAAPTSTTNPPNVEGGSNLQFPQDNGQEMSAADIANPPFDGATSYHRATPTPNSSFTVGDLTSFMESLDAETSNAQENSANTSQHSSQPLQSDRECGYGTGLEPPIHHYLSTGPLYRVS